MQQGKNERKEHSDKKNCQEDLWQKNYLDSQIRSMTKNIGKGQNGIGSDGKEEKENKP